MHVNYYTEKCMGAIYINESFTSGSGIQIKSCILRDKCMPFK